MNKQEYEEMRLEFADLVYRYEAFMKRGYLTDCRYSLTYFEALKEARRYESEAAVITQAIQSKDKYKIEEILKAIDNAKESYKQEMIQTENKHNYCVQLFSIINKFDKSVFDESENLFRKFIYDYHPVVCLNASKDAKNVYEMLKKFYFECNHLGFKEFLEMNKKVFEVDPITEDRYVEASQVYFQFRGNINNTFNQLEKQYPYNKISVFEDEMRIIAEKDDLEIRVKKLKELLKNVRKDFFDAFGFEMKFVDEE
ncbi:MAG: hypothetical protein IJS83_02375 [Acholeplasmatales bacterium]|nr:hypothetical protein [Acholeplasmatales bacterium]